MKHFRLYIGWIVTILFIAVMVTSNIAFYTFPHKTLGNWLVAIVYDSLLIVGFIILARTKSKAFNYKLDEFKKRLLLLNDIEAIEEFIEQLNKLKYCASYLERKEITKLIYAAEIKIESIRAFLVQTSNN